MDEEREASLRLNVIKVLEMEYGLQRKMGLCYELCSEVICASKQQAGRTCYFVLV